LATNPTGEKLATLYTELSTVYSETDIEKSMYYARESIVLHSRFNNYEDIGYGYKTLGINFYSLSQYDSALVYFDKAVGAYEKMRGFPKKWTEKDIEDGVVSTYGTIGNLYNILGKYHDAIEYYHKALILFEKYDWKQSQASAYNNIGAMYRAMGNYRQAEISLIKADSLAHEADYPLRIANAKQQFSYLYIATKEYGKALQNALIAYDMFFSHAQEGIKKAEVLNILSEIYLDGFDDEQKAEDYARQALLLLDGIDVPREKAISLYLLSAIHLKRGEWSKAEQTAIDALAKDDSEPANTLALYQILVKAYTKSGNSNRAWEYFDKHNALQASWSTKHYQSSLRELEVKYETGKKEHEIERQQHIISRQNMERALLAAGIILCIVFLTLLWYMLRQRARRNRILAETNATKDKFFNIISHDLKNPAVAIRDNLKLLVHNVALWDVDTLSGYGNELLKSAEGQVELLNSLLQWARLQTGRITCIPVTFDLAARLRTDISLIRKMAENKNIALTLRLPEQALIFGDGNMLLTVIRNLLTNAVKFTPAGGAVVLEASPNPSGGGASGESKGAFTVSVSDTGTGMSDEQIRTLFRLDKPQSRRGTGGEEGAGLGLIVCRELLEKHGSALHIESKAGKGSRFWFTV
jgi:signal transduction histidine kinase